MPPGGQPGRDPDVRRGGDGHRDRHRTDLVAAGRLRDHADRRAVPTAGTCTATPRWRCPRPGQVSSTASGWAGAGWTACRAATRSSASSSCRSWVLAPAECRCHPGLASTYVNRDVHRRPPTTAPPVRRSPSPRRTERPLRLPLPGSAGSLWILDALLKAPTSSLSALPGWHRHGILDRDVGMRSSDQHYRDRRERLAERAGAVNLLGSMFIVVRVTVACEVASQPARRHSITRMLYARHFENARLVKYPTVRFIVGRCAGCLPAPPVPTCTGLSSAQSSRCVPLRRLPSSRTDAD